MRYQIQLLSIEYFALSLLLGLILIPLLSSAFWLALRDTAVALLHMAGLFQNKASHVDEPSKHAEQASSPVRASGHATGVQHTVLKVPYESKGGIRSAEWYGTGTRPARRRHK
jgi:hypothetical protein